MKFRFITGSQAFFTTFEDFKPKDIDVCIIDDDPKDYSVFRYTSLRKGKCVFEYKEMPIDEFISFVIEHPKPEMKVVMFLCPEFIEHYGLTIEQLKRLQPLVDNLDKKHRYAEIIYNSYIENNAFTLTDEQLKQAYDDYKETRKSDAE